MRQTHPTPKRRATQAHSAVDKWRHFARTWEARSKQNKARADKLEARLDDLMADYEAVLEALADQQER